MTKNNLKFIHSAVSVEDESKWCGELIVRFIEAARHDDLETQLNFYVECRAAFLKLDAVLVALVHVRIGISFFVEGIWG